MSHIPEKITTEEIFAIIVFAVAIVLTQNFAIAMLGAFAIMGFALWLIPKIRRYLKSKKMQENIRNKGKVMIWFLLSLVFIDMLLTYYAVHWVGFAYEMNKVAVALWNIYGVFFGEVIRVGAFLCVWLLAFVNIRHENPKRVLASFTFVLLTTIGWSIVVLNNIYWTISYFIS